MSTNGLPDSGHDLTESEHEDATADAYRAEHPDCVSCALECCIAGPGCGCGNDSGHRAPGQDGERHPEYVHAGICETLYVTEERVMLHEERMARLEEAQARADASTREHARFLFEAISARMVLEVATAIYRLREPAYGAVAVPFGLCQERARNIVAGILGSYRVTPLPEGPRGGETTRNGQTTEPDFNDGRIS